MRLISYKKPILLLGDGAKLCYTEFQDEILALLLAPEHLRYQQATGVAAQAILDLADGMAVSAESLQPIYLRLPQAERELRARTQQKESTN